MHRIACITGASSGIGEEFSRQLARKGYDLILVARSTDKLDILAKEIADRHTVSCEVIPCDLAKEDECLSLIRILKQRKPYLMINNAGFGDIGYFQETAQEKDLKMIDVNIRALHLITKAVLEDMVARDKGYILNVASVAGLMPGGPLMATYYATKSYVLSLTTSIAEELRQAGSNVRVSALCPGPVNTGFNEVAGVSFAMKGISPARCVSDCLKKMDRGKLIIVPGVLPRLAVLGARLMPVRTSLAVIAKAQKSKIRES